MSECRWKLVLLELHGYDIKMVIITRGIIICLYLYMHICQLTVLGRCDICQDEQLEKTVPGLFMCLSICCGFFLILEISHINLRLLVSEGGRKVPSSKIPTKLHYKYTHILQIYILNDAITISLL